MAKLDFPLNPSPGATYVAPNGVTYEWDTSIGIGVWTAVTSAPFAIASAGSISGSPQVGSTLTYTPGSYIGGQPTVTESWIWKKASDGSTLQTNGTTFLVTSGLVGQRVYVEYKVIDATPTTLTANTNNFPTAPATITTAGFPPSAWAPTPTGAMTSGYPGTSSGTWNGGNGATITATGCVEVSTDGSTYGPSVTVNNSQTLYQRWSNTGPCGGAASGTTITGGVSNGTYTNSYTLQLDRVPAPIADISDSNVTLGSTVTKATASGISGINAPAYVTYVNTSTGTSIQAATAPGGPFTTLATSGIGFPVTNGQTLYIRQTVGSGTSTGYTAIIRVGDGTNAAGTYDEFIYTATTVSSAAFPSMPPSLTAGPTTSNGTASGTWASGADTLTSTGCLKISTDNITFNQGPLSIANGQTLYEQWDTSPSCGGANSGTTITGALNGTVYSQSYTLTLDRTPAAISFTGNPNVPLSSVQTSNVVTLSGTNAPSYLTYDAASTGDNTTYFAIINSGAAVAIPAAPSTACPVPPGATLAVRQTAASTANNTRDLVVKLGNSDGTASVTGTFSVLTTSNPAFINTVFTPTAGPTASPSTTNLTGPSLFGVASTTNWADGITSLTSTGDLLFRIPPAAFGQSAVTVNPGNTVELAWDNAAALAAVSGTGTLTGTLTNGTYINSYSLAVDKASDSYGWTDLTLQPKSTTIQSNIVTITGLNTPAELTCTPDPTNPLGTVQASINGGIFTTIPTTAPGLIVNPANGAGTTATTIQLQGVTGSGNTVAYKVTTELGFGGTVVTDEWSVTTTSVTPTVAQPTVINPNGSSLNPAGGLTLQGDAYVGNNSPGAHNSSDWQLLQMGVTATNPETAAINTVTQNSVTWTQQVSSFGTTYIEGVTYGGTFVAVGRSGKLATSSDGVNWTQQTSSFSSSDIYTVTNGGGLYVAAGTSGKLATSSNGTTWTQQTSGFGADSIIVVGYGGSLYLAGGGSAKLATSPDGVNWTLRTSTFTGFEEINAIAYGGGTYVIGGMNGKINTSADGINWTAQTSGFGTSRIYSITYANGQFVAVGAGGKIATSPNGTTWTQQTSGGGSIIYSIAYGNGSYVACTDSGVLTSSDGVTWTTSTLTMPSGNATTAVTYGNSLFVVTSNGGDIATSTSVTSSTTLTLASASGLASMQVGDTLVEVGGGADATGTITAINTGIPSVTVTPSSTNWTTTATAKDTSRTTSTVDTTLISTNTISGASTTAASWASQTSGTSENLNGLTYGGGQFVAACGGGIILTSSNGTSWASQSSGTTQGLYGITYANSKYVVVGLNGTILTSSNGTAWTSQTGGTTSFLYGVNYGNSQYIAVGADSGGTVGVILTSPNGTTWTSQTSGTTNYLNSVVYANSQYVVVGGSGTILTSSNGTAWTGQTSGTAVDLNNLTYAGGQFVAVGNNGTILTSPNGTAWTSQTSGTAQPLTGVTYSNGQFIATGQNGTILVSTNATAWTAQTSGTTAQLRTVACSTSQCVIGGSLGAILTSSGSTSNLTISGADTDGFAVGNLVSNGLTTGSAFGTITAINGTTVTVAPSSANWANGQNLYRGKTILNADDDTSNLETYLVPGSDFLAGTTYNARVRYNSISNPPIYTSPWSNWKTFGTA